MKHTALLFLTLLALTASAAASRADEVQYSGPPGVTLYSMPHYAGRRVVLRTDTPKLKKFGFAAVAMSMKVSGGRWEVCDGNRYSGTCEVFGPGDYSFGIFNWGNKIRSVRKLRPGTPVITLFARPGMRGEHHSWAGSVPRIKDFATNDFAQSVKVEGGAWVLCENSQGKGRCEMVRSDIPNLASIGLAGAVSSLYRASDWRRDDYAGGPDDPGYGPGYGYGGQDYDAGYARITLFEGYDFTGPRITFDREEADLRRIGFSNRASSARIEGGAWELCDGAGFTKSCRVLRRDVRNLGVIGLDSLVTSLRPVDDGLPGRRAGNGRGVEGERTVFFAEPLWRGQPVASALYRHGGDAQAAANAFCRTKGLRQAVYFDEARSYAAPVFLGSRQRARQGGQLRLVDVLCLR